MNQAALPTILILAGQRLGEIDPLAAMHGQEHKCFVPLLGRPLIGYVLDAVSAAFPTSPIAVSINDAPALLAHPEVTRYLADGRLTAIPSAQTLLESVLLASEQVAFPLLITTADNVMITEQALRSVHDFAIAQGAEGAALFVPKEKVRAVHDEGKPAYWRFRDGEFSACNTFWLGNRSALSMAEIFRGGGQFLKHPKRFLSAFGLINLIGFRFNMFTSRTMLARLSQRFGCRLVAQFADDGALAIDVDDERSRIAARRLLSLRGVDGPDD